MTDRYNPQHGANMVDRYIGSAFDIVYAVYKQLDSMPVFLEFVTETSPRMEDQYADIIGRFDHIVGLEASALNSKEVAEQAASDAMDYRDTTQQLINDAEEFKQFVINVVDNTIQDIEDRFAEFIVASGYEFIGNYGIGIEVTEYNQLLRDVDGEFWRLSGQRSIPYITTGAGMPEDDAFIPVGDASLRQDLDDLVHGSKIIRYDENNSVYDAINRNREDFWANKETMGGIYTHYVRENDGTPVAGADCAVYVGKTGVLATGLKDKYGMPLANPFTSTASGLVQFIADPGMYTLQVSFDLVVRSYSVYFADGGLRNDLADSTKGSNLIGYGESNVHNALEELEQFNASLSDPDMGAAMVAYEGGNVADKLDEIVSGAVTEPLVVAKVNTHNHNENSHPELRFSIVSEVTSHVTNEADRAELAADAAQLSAGVYPDTTSGISATSIGQYFSVPSGVDNEYLILYLHEAGPVATEIKRYPSADLVNELDRSLNRNLVNSTYSWGVLDAEGKLALGVKKDGLVSAQLDTESITFAAENVPGHKLSTEEDLFYSWGILDAENKLTLGIRKDGRVRALLDTESLQYIKDNLPEDDLPEDNLLTFADNRYGYDAVYVFNQMTGRAIAKPTGKVLYMIMHAGQSLSVGGGAAAYVETPELATVSKVPEFPEYCLMFNTGARGRESVALNPSTLTSFEGIHEHFNGTRVGETPGSGMLSKLRELFLEDGATGKVFLYRSHGSGGKAYADLKKGTNPYANAMIEVQRAVDIAAEYGWTVVVPAILITHGEQDRGSNFNYDADLYEWITDYRTDIPEITKQSEEISIFIDQLSISRNVSGNPSKVQLDQLSIRDSLPGVYLSTPKYHLPYVDTVHMTATGYRLLGELQAKAIKTVMDGGNWRPLEPLSATLTDDVIDIVFNVPVAPITIDTSTIPGEPNYGFVYEDDLSSATILSVTVLSADTIRVLLSASPTGANKKIKYAFDNTTKNGNLRDSDPAIGYLETALHNWCVSFSINLG